jgi:beta-lactamase class A
MVRGIPEGVMVAEKPGELEGVRADSGIVFAQKRPFVLSVMTTYLSDEKDGAKAIESVARAVFPYFDMMGRATEYGRVISERNSR